MINLIIVLKKSVKILTREVKIKMKSADGSKFKKYK
jgi:hypothetical protein